MLEAGVRREVGQALLDADCLWEGLPSFGCHPEREFVTGESLERRGACFGDSGGPAYREHDRERPVLVGITSRTPPGRSCGRGTIFVRIDVHADWIRSVCEAQ